MTIPVAGSTFSSMSDQAGKIIEVINSAKSDPNPVDMDALKSDLKSLIDLLDQ